MKFWKGSEGKRQEKRTLAATALRDRGLKVDGSWNVRDNDFILGSLTPEADFTYPVGNERLPTMEIVRAVIHGIDRSTVSYGDWKPNA